MSSPLDTPWQRARNGDELAYDTVLLAARIVTLSAQQPVAEALAIRDGRIVAVGSRAEGAAWARVADHVLDLGTATATPGLADSHAHPISGMKTVRGVDCGLVESIEQLSAALRAEAARLPPDAWILGWNLSPQLYATTTLDVEYFAAVAPGRPVLVKSYDYHSAFASADALQLAGVTGPIVFASGAEIVCDSAGRPTGVLQEMDAVAVVESAIPQPDLDAQAHELLDTLDGMASTGLTLTHSLTLDPGDLELLEEAECIGELSLRYHVSPVCGPAADEDERYRLLQLQGRRGRRWRVDGVKFFLDGTIDNGTAWLSRADSHGESTASTWQDLGAYADAVAFFAAHGVRTATHAIGDAAIEFALQTLGALTTPVDGQHRIEHLEYLPGHLVPLFAEYDVAASMQPAHSCTSVHADQSDNWSERLGSDRAVDAFPQRDLIDSGAALVLGSDWPIGPYDAREIMGIARLRRPVRAPERAPVLPAQRLDALEALAAYTATPAAVGGRSGEGVIAVGRLATLTVFATDPLTADADELSSIPVLLTLIAGEIGYAGG